MDPFETGSRFAKRSLVVLALWTTQIGATDAFELHGADWSYKPRPTEISWTICSFGLPPGAARAIALAVSEWSTPSLILRAVTGDCGSSNRFPSVDGYNRIDFGPLEQLAAPGRSQLQESDGRILECDIRFNDALKWHVAETAPAETEWDLSSVALHEIGHCIGLADVTDRAVRPPPVMLGVLAPGEKRRKLTKDDIDGRAATLRR